MANDVALDYSRAVLGDNNPYRQQLIEELERVAPHLVYDFVTLTDGSFRVFIEVAEEVPDVDPDNRIWSRVFPDRGHRRWILTIEDFLESEVERMSGGSYEDYDW